MTLPSGARSTPSAACSEPLRRTGGFETRHENHAMRITIVTGPFYPVPPAPCGAVERLWRDLAERFAGLGHQVTVLCRHWPGQNKDETVAGVRYVRRMRMSHTK